MLSFTLLLAEPQAHVTVKIAIGGAQEMLRQITEARRMKAPKLANAHHLKRMPPEGSPLPHRKDHLLRADTKTDTKRVKIGIAQ